MIKIQAFAMSLFFHVLVAASCVLTFPAQPVGHKPIFVFLGSILDKGDLMGHPRYRVLLSQDPLSSPVALPVSRGKFYPPKTTAVSKPVFQSGRQAKETQKSSFEKVTVRKPRSSVEDQREDMGIELDVPRRIPLKLYGK